MKPCATSGNQSVKKYLNPVLSLQEKLSKVKISSCQNGIPYIKIDHVANKSSASNSIMLFGLLEQHEVVAKISYTNIDESKDNSIKVERMIYELSSELLKHTPNVIPFLYGGTCSDLINSESNNPIEKEIYIQAQAIIANDKNKTLDVNKPQIIVTSKSKGKSIYDWLQADWNGWSSIEKNKFMRDVLYQIAYTLLVFKDFGLMHHDLHARNILVEFLPEQHQLSFELFKGYSVGKQIRFFVQIFDYDHASLSNTSINSVDINNSKLDNGFCSKFGECNQFIENFDWYTIIHNMHAQFRGNEVFFANIFDEKDLNLKARDKSERSIPWIGRPCICKDGQCNTCNPFTPKAKLSPLEFLISNYEKISCHPDYSRI